MGTCGQDALVSHPNPYYAQLSCTNKMAVFISSSLQSQCIGPLIPQNYPFWGAQTWETPGARTMPTSHLPVVEVCLQSYFGELLSEVFSRTHRHWDRVSEKLLGAQTALLVGGGGGLETSRRGLGDFPGNWVL